MLKTILFVMALLTPTLATAETVAATDQIQIDCLTENIYHEARSQSIEGQRAVALVTMNRVASDAFPNTVCKVTKQSNRNADGSIKLNRCQFSWYCDGASDAMKEPNAKATAAAIAQEIYFDQSDDITDGATYYHASYMTPYWAKRFELVGMIGSHKFYRN